MDTMQIIHGKANLLPYEEVSRSPFDSIYQEAEKLMERTEYVWVNRRQIAFRWDFDFKCYVLDIINPTTGKVENTFFATKEAIRTWASRSTANLSRDVWTIVAYTVPGEEYPVALSVLTDQYAILSYTDIISAVEEICKKISENMNVELHGFSIHPDKFTMNIVMADLAIPVEESMTILDVISVGVKVTSGLTGQAAVRITPWAKRTKCDNSLMFSDENNDFSTRIVHRWGGMRFQLNPRQTLNERNISWLNQNASYKVGWKFRNALWRSISSNYEEAYRIVKGAAAASQAKLEESEASHILSRIINSWLGESEIEGIDIRKKALKKFEYFKDAGSRTRFYSRVASQLRRYAREFGYSMYTIIQALTEQSILSQLPDDVKVVVEDWAARYCIGLADQYDPEMTKIQRIPPDEVKLIIDSLEY